jgi:cytochrome b
VVTRRARPRKIAGDGRVLVWDAAVRLLHWLLAGLVLFAYFIEDDGGWVHRTIGYVAVGAVCSRLLWAGLCEGANGFAALRPSLRKTLAYGREGAPRTVAHDPFGLWMVWLLWLLVLLLGLGAHCCSTGTHCRRRDHGLALAREPGAGDDHREEALALG